MAKYRRRVDPRDGPVARIGTPQWKAWQDYYLATECYFAARLMREYAGGNSDWPTASEWPPPLEP